LRALRAAPRVRRPTRTFQAFRSNVASPTGLARALLTLAAVRIGNMIAVILFSEGGGDVELHEFGRHGAG